MFIVTVEPDTVPMLFDAQVPPVMLTNPGFDELVFCGAVKPAAMSTVTWPVSPPPPLAVYVNAYVFVLPAPAEAGLTVIVPEPSPAAAWAVVAVIPTSETAMSRGSVSAKDVLVRANHRPATLTMWNHLPKGVSAEGPVVSPGAHSTNSHSRWRCPSGHGQNCVFLHQRQALRSLPTEKCEPRDDWSMRKRRGVNRFACVGA
jgi:hypothetical protein